MESDIKLVRIRIIGVKRQLFTRFVDALQFGDNDLCIDLGRGGCCCQVCCVLQRTSGFPGVDANGIVFPRCALEEGNAHSGFTGFPGFGPFGPDGFIVILDFSDIVFNIFRQLVISKMANSMYVMEAEYLSLIQFAILCRSAQIKT